MTYFRNKFDEEFRVLCELINPKGGTIKIGDHTDLFTQFTFVKGSPVVNVIPLLLYNELTSTNKADTNIHDHVMVCKNVPDTTITCSYDPDKQEITSNYTCDILAPTGELIDDNTDNTGDDWA